MLNITKLTNYKIDRSSKKLQIHSLAIPQSRNTHNSGEILEAESKESTATLECQHINRHNAMRMGMAVNFFEKSFSSDDRDFSTDA